jgi:hypothetical protein
MATEPYIAMKIEPGGDFTWRLRYDYYTFPPKAESDRTGN